MPEPQGTPCPGDEDGSEVEAKRVTVYFLIPTFEGSGGIVAVLNKLRPSSPTSQWCNAELPNALRRAGESSPQHSALSILDIDVNPDMLEKVRRGDVNIRREGVGLCLRTGVSNCGENADCIDHPETNSHDCVCHAGFKRGDTATSCVAADTGTSAAGVIAAARRDGDYLLATYDEIGTCDSTAACAGMTTYLLKGTLRGGATNVYAMFGEEGDRSLDLPPAYQSPKPYGVDVGGVNPLLWEVAPAAHRPQSDSWVTIGVTTGTVGQISTIGIDWDCWQDHDVSDLCDDRDGRLHITDGAVFWMNPDAGPDGVDVEKCPGRTDNACPIVLAQITMRSPEYVQLGLQGRHPARDNWKDYPVRRARAARFAHNPMC